MPGSMLFLFFLRLEFYRFYRFCPSEDMLPPCAGRGYASRVRRAPDPYLPAA